MPKPTATAGVNIRAPPTFLGHPPAMRHHQIPAERIGPIVDEDGRKFLMLSNTKVGGGRKLMAKKYIKKK